MARHDVSKIPPIGLDDLLKAYMLGYFPMADSRDDPRLYWVAPERRGVLPLDAVRAPRKLRRKILADEFDIRVDSDFAGVIEGCAEPRPGREETWINDQIRALYLGLHERGYAHSVEAWRGEVLAGGLYGVALGGAFFGESMFSRESDASKIALIHLAARLKRGGFTLLDTQFHTEHLAQFGVEEIPKADYLQRLELAIEVDADFYAAPPQFSGAAAMQSITHTS